MDSQVKIPPPEVGGDTNTHLWYMRRDIGEIKSTLVEMKNSYVTRIDFDEHLKTDDDHETRIRMNDKSITDLKETVSNMQTSILTTIKTWGTIGGVILFGVEIIQFVYFFTHLQK